MSTVGSEAGQISDLSLDEGRDTIVTPLSRRTAGGNYILAAGDLELEVAPHSGGRITRFAHRGKNILAGPERHELYWGSTFWTSPESDWNQPPPVAIDSGPYEVLSDGQALRLESRDAASFSEKTIKVRKSFRPDTQDGSIIVEYEIVNVSRDKTFCLAPWEVTRLPGGGVCFFPYEKLARATDGIGVEVRDGVAWFDHRTQVQAGGQKAWLDGRDGWAAHVHGGLLHIKRFSPLPEGEEAPGESEVEIYSSGLATDARAYVELEVQGPYTRLQPGVSVSWAVRWYLVPLPPHVRGTKGESSLVDLAREVLANSNG